MATPAEELETLKLKLAQLTQRVAELEQLTAQSLKQPEAEAPPQIRTFSSTPDAALPRQRAIQPPPLSPAPQPSHIPTPVLSSKARASVSTPFAKFSASHTNGSMEEKIGQYWLNRVGIVAILIGVSYFLKYAFENNWIGAAGRIVIGIIAGIGLVLWSERFRNRGYAAFSYSLKAIGIGTLYLSFWGAFQVYHLIPSSVAFVAMIIVTASTMVLAFSQDAELLASFALIGGFATPMLLSTGENHEVVLFSYVCVLDMAVLLLAILKPWQRLLWGSFAGTIILFLSWAGTYYTVAQRADTVFFAAVFSTLFAIVPLILRRDGAAERRRAQNIMLMLLPLLNAGLFFLALYVMYELETATLTWYALVLAAVYLGIANAYKKLSKPSEQDSVYLLHVAIAIAFITIAIPAKLQAHWITIGWLVESAALLWVSVKTKTDFLRYLAVAALGLGIARLLFFDQMLAERLVFNARFASYLVAVAILAAIAYYGKEHAFAEEALFIDAAFVGANVLALIALTWEAADFFGQRIATAGANYHELSLIRGFTYSAIWLIYGAALMACGFWSRSAFMRWQALALIAITTIKIFVFDVSQLGGSYRIISFIVLGTVLLAISFVYQRDWLRLSAHASEKSVDGSR